MKRERGGGDGRAASFADALDELKRRGSTLLVVGGPDPETDRACERLLGEPAARRRHLYVRTATGGTRDVEGVPSRTVTYGGAARSTAAASGGATEPTDAVVDGDLGDLQAAVDDAVDALRPADGFEPAELRLCVDAADSLLASHDEARVFQFLHAVRGRMRETGGMGHVHLPVAFDDRHVHLLAPLFDAVIEVRAGGQQRWHLEDPDLTTDWLPL